MKISQFEMRPKHLENPEMGSQCLLKFGEEYALSIITGGYAYCSESAPYEIAIFRNESFCRLPGISDPDDDVLGHQTEAQVNAIILKLHTLTGEKPVQCFQKR